MTFSFGLFHLDVLVLVDKQELSNNSFLRKEDVVWKTSLERWMVGTNEERVKDINASGTTWWWWWWWWWWWYRCFFSPFIRFPVSFSLRIHYNLFSLFINHLLPLHISYPLSSHYFSLYNICIISFFFSISSLLLFFLRCDLCYFSSVSLAIFGITFIYLILFLNVL